MLFALIMVAPLFFIWGFCHAMLDVLSKDFQNILQVSKAQSGLIQTSVFGAYFLMALPSLLIRRIGYHKGILLGLVVVAIGAFLFVPAGLIFKTFAVFLFARSSFRAASPNVLRLLFLSHSAAWLKVPKGPVNQGLQQKDKAFGLFNGP